MLECGNLSCCLKEVKKNKLAGEAVTTDLASELC